MQKIGAVRAQKFLGASPHQPLISILSILRNRKSMNSICAYIFLWSIVLVCLFNHTSRHLRKVNERAVNWDTDTDVLHDRSASVMLQHGALPTNYPELSRPLLYSAVTNSTIP